MHEATKIKESSSSLGARLLKAVLNPQKALRAAYVLILREPWRYFLTYLFDKRNHVKTRGMVRKADLNPVNPGSLKHGIHYEPVPLVILDILMKELRNESPDMCFVDIGCGKGLACFYAARKFKKLIGIDYSEKLVMQANANLRSFANKNNASIRFEVSDARNYRLLDKPSLVYMYNPFDAHILRTFLQNNIRHFRENNSRLLYVNDVHRDVLEEIGFVEDYRNRYHNLSIHSLTGRTEERTPRPEEIPKIVN